MSKARFIVHGNREKEKEFIIYISKTIRHNIIKMLTLISVIQRLRVWNQDVNKAYIQTHNLERDVYFILDPMFNL